MSENTEQQQNSDEDSSRDEDIVTHVQSANKWETADLGETDRKSKFLRLMGAAKKDHHGKFVIGDQKPSDARPTTKVDEVVATDLVLPCLIPELDEHQLTEDLEVQFVQGLEHQRIGGRRGHIGLGYHSSTQDGSTQQDGSTGQDSSTGQAQSASESDKHSHDTADSSPNKRSAETKTKDTSETTKEKKDKKKDVEKKDEKTDVEKKDEKKDVEKKDEKKDVTKSDQEELGPTAAKKYKMTFVKASS